MSDAKSYAERNQRGNDWFSHDASSSGQHVEKVAAASGAEPSGDAAVGRTQMIKPECNSNQWFKHEHKDEPDATSEPTVTAAEAVPVAAAAAGDGTAAGSSREGDVYSKRNKAGSAASWFSHDHTNGSTAAHGPRVTTKEGGDNATRMRGESENWFSYDGSNSPHDIHVGKARSTRPQSDNMRGIFNMN